MEKIKKAIEESKRSRSSAQASENNPGAPSAKENGPSINSTEVVYDQTRVIKLDPEHLAEHRIVAFDKDDYRSLGFDILRTQVINKMLENGWRTIAITSPTPSCGKSVVSINLAMSIAHHTDRTAMLVDFDLRKPSIAKYLGLPHGPSLNDVLSGDATVAEALVNPGLDRFVVLPTAMPISHSSEMLSSRKVGNLVEELRDRYEERIVLFDLTPILGSDDAMIMLSQVDCVLVVVGNGMVGKGELEESMLHIDEAKLIGTVLNKSESKQSQYRYYGY